MSHEFTTLLVEYRPDRVHVQLNRPDVRNAIDQTMIDELHQVCAELERGPRILILSGTNGVFASGADIAQLRDRRAEDALKGINSSLFARIARLPLPVIAAIDGWALGGGAELAYAADFRIASETARLGNPETALGIIPAAGALWRLAELVGEPVAKEIILAGRILTAAEALAVHLVTEVHEPDALLAAAHALADRIARQDPLATQLAKEVFHVPAHEHPQADNEAQARLFESEEKFTRMTAFLERKKR
ncbi:enoyl-CoA hydratase/isomerase family protein [Cryobacterium sp. TMT1-21]|uniref:Enoyl-CoA hydratase/isomerase family protein n=1 Tax=Cryobacterium shii TaxID=1259235 RepID=A0AAQ2C3N0_9MICO|nr:MULTISPECIES: enoyl-CoA hydratase/isomerase family protein [Cryobacterium]TFC41144.1 enoyl-CoA hydratase/isomerase family protein [Cryobacterium shii]TFC89402.1 enoyl-CoA hydratase/isomerase family protein [Cryobacterium sp. TmT2-59]TFD15940.1 enoyl-CoA hydratase/isomerase family protein [Cryobacterium sp. TMT1-21]TFD19788.1 enoyl-CoA hydratase/isomerase family protein [Cryobacterium sp. TMT2-23]